MIVASAYDQCDEGLWMCIGSGGARCPNEVHVGVVARPDQKHHCECNEQG